MSRYTRKQFLRLSGTAIGALALSPSITACFHKEEEKNDDAQYDIYDCILAERVQWF